MKTRILNAARLSFPLACALAALLAAPSVHAGQIWDGGGADNNWNTAANWDADALPTFTNAITFAGATRLTPANNLAAASTIGGISFTNTATNAFTLTGNSITLGGAITTTAATSGSLTDTINLAVILSANRTITTNTNHNLTINGVISQSAASSLTKAGAATLTLGGTNTYAGATIIQGGTLRLANTGAVGGSSGITMNTASNTLSIGTDSAMSLPSLTGSSGSLTYTIVSDRTAAGAALTHGFSGANFGNATFATNAGINVTSGTAGISFSGSPTIGGGSAGTATFAPGSANLTLPSLTATNASKTLALAGTGNGFITGVISPGTVGITAVNKSGTSTWTLSGLNTFVGNVTISAGTLVAGSSGNGANSNLGPVNNTRTINVNTGGTLRFDAPNVFHPTFSTPAGSLPVLNIAGGTMTNGGTAANSALGNITLAGGTLTATTGSPIGTGQSGEGWGSWNLNGTVTSTGASTISSTAPGGIPITLSATSTNNYITTFDVQSGTLTASAPLGNVTRIGNETISGLTKIGAGTLVLSGTNTYTGNTAINVGPLSIGSKDSLPGFDVPGRFTVASGATLAVQNTVPESDISVLLGTGNFIAGSNLGFDTTAGDRTVAMNLANAANGPLGIVKLGANTLTLSGTNTYTGGTTVQAGALYLGSTGSLPNWNVNGGFSVADGASLIIPNTVSEAEVTTLLGTTNIASGAALLFDTSLGDRTYTSAVTNSTQGLLNIGKIGANALTLAGANTYTGNTSVTQGTMNITGSIAGSASTSNFTYGTAAATTTVNVLSGANLTLAALQGANNTSAVSLYRQSGGTVTVGAPLSTAESAYAANSGYGHFNLSGGSVTVHSRFTAASNGGAGGKGVARVGGGAGSAALTVGELLAVSRGAGSIGELTVLANGAVTFNGTGANNMLIHGNNTLGTGYLNISGGTFSSPAKPVAFGNGTATDSSLGMLNVGAGTLELSSNLLLNTIATGTNKGFVNFAGGTVKLLANTTGNLLLPASNGGFAGLANTIFGKVTNSTANLDSTGAPSAVSGAVGTTQDFGGSVTINTNGFSSTISAPLMAPIGGGVAQGNISITDAGAGYAAPPTVVFSTPSTPNATPAAGYALVSGGQLTGIVITCPGSYDAADTVMVTLTGGGGTTPATVASIPGSSLTANTSGGLTKTGAGTLTLSGTNTYTGMTTVNAGSLTVSGAGTLSASTGLTVGNGATFNYLPTTVGTNLAVSTLNLNDGSSIGLAWNTVGSNKITASGAAVVGTGAGVGINLTGTPTLGTPYTILEADSGLDSGSYVLFNPTDYYGTIIKSAKAVTVTATTASPLTEAYWKGGYAGFSGVWAVSNGLSGGSGLSNWTMDPAGTVVTPLVPGSGTDVFLSASGAAAGDQNAMTLGANMVIKSLTVNHAGSPNTNPVTLLGTDGATLTLAAASGTGITVNAGSGAVTLASNIALGALQTWSNHSTNTLTVSGAVSGAFGLIKAGTGLVNITGATAVASTTVEAGTLYMGAQTGASTTTTLGAANAVTLNNSSNLTIRRTNTGGTDVAGVISGAGSLTLLGDNVNIISAGDFVMNNTSDAYSGAVTITGARVQYKAASALGTGPITTGANGQVFFDAGMMLTNNFTLGSGLGWNEPSGYLGALRMNGTTISGNITLTADTRITGTNTSTLSGVISGGFGLDFFEDTVIGTISLSGANDYTGTTIVNSMGSGSTFPNLIVSHNNGLGTTAGGTVVYGTGTSGTGSVLTLASGITVTDETLTLDPTANSYRASLQTSGTAIWDGNLILAGTGGMLQLYSNSGGNLTVGGSDADAVTGNNSLLVRGAGTGTVNSTLAMGAGNLVKTDGGTWTIASNNNTYTGYTQAAGGVLSFGTIANSGANCAIGAGNSILLGQNSATAGVLQFTGASGGSSNRALTLANGTTGGVGVIENTVSGQTLTLSGALTTATPASASTLTLTGAGDGVLNGGIVGTPLLTLNKTGAGSWSLSGTITYRAATTVTDGTLNFDAASVFDSATSVGTFIVNGTSAVANIAGTYNVASGNGNAYFEIKGGGTLNFSGNATLGDGVTGAGVRVGEGGIGTMTMTGGTFNTNLNSSSNFVVGRSAGGSGTLNISGGTLTVTGTGGIQIANTAGNTGVLTVSGTGQLVMSSSGAVTMGAGTSTINLNSGGTFTLGSAISTSSGASTINFDGGTLKAGANITIPATLTTANVKDGGAIFDTNGNTITVNEPLLNFAGATTDGLTKLGTGTLILSGVNTYTGATTVNGGTLLVNSPGSLAAVSAVAVNNTSTLGGNGTIGGNVTVTAAGNLAPGASAAGTLTVGGALDISALAGGAGTLAYELNTLAASDKIVAGTLAIGSGALGFNDFAFTNLGGLQAGTYPLITSGGLTGTLDATDLTGMIGAFKATLQLSGTGNDVELVVSSAYTSWAALKGLDGTSGKENGKADDPDNDGKNNLYEFAFDGNPLAGANDGKLVGKLATVGGDQVMTLTLPVRTGAAFSADSGDQLSALIDGIYYRIEGDKTLSPFADNITEVTTGDETAIQAGLPALSTGWTYRTFRTPGTVSTEAKAFLRAKISETP